MFDLIVLLLVLGLVIGPIVLAVRHSRWRRNQEARLDRVIRTIGELREQVGMLSRRLSLVEDGSGHPTREKPSPAVTAEPVTTEARPMPAPAPAVTTEKARPAMPEAPPAPPPREGGEGLGLPPIPKTGVAGFQRKLASLENVFRPRRREPAEAPGEAAPEKPRGMGRFERLFMENWTGILGALVVVAGVTFVGIYTAIRLAPVYRFLMTLGVGGVLVGGALVLGKKEAWRDFATWIRSAGAAIVLFACAAAGGLPGLGLKWIDAPSVALALLLAGIGLNLLFAWIGKAEVFASLHVVLSLVPMAIVPPGVVGLAVASAVAVFGVGLAVYGRWDRHLLVVVVAYAAFQILWFTRIGSGLDLGSVRVIAFGCAAVVFGAAMAAHHRKGYARAEGDPLQMAAHIGSAGLLALVTFVYLTDVPPRSAVLAALAAVTWLLARRGRESGVAWLYRADVLGGQGFLLLALAGVLDLGASFLLVAVAALAELVGFRWLVPRERDALLDRIVDILPVIAAVSVGFAVLEAVTAGEMPLPQITGLAVVAVALSLVGQWASHTPAEAPDANPWIFESPGALLGPLAGMLAVVGMYAAINETWMEAAGLVVVGGLLAVRARTPRSGLTAGALMGLAGVHLVSWASLLAGADWAPAALSPRIVPLAALAAGGIWLAEGRIRQVAIVLLGADAGLAAYLYLDPVSALVPGVAWLMLSLIALEIANRLEDGESSVTLWIGYGYLVAFAVAYGTIIVQTPAYVAGIRARLLIEVFAVAVFAYWWFFRPRKTLTESPAWLKVHPYFLEVLLVAVSVMVVVELPSVWWAVAWALMALMLLVRPVEQALDPRARFYSLVFYWLSIADMATILSVLETPARAWHQQPEVVSLLAIALQLAYVVHAHYRLELSELPVPESATLVRRAAGAVARRRNLFVYYPLFAGVAVFLYWRFDRSVLTLLWAAEAFVVFVLSAWLRENQFRYVALAGLGVCLVRLVFIDMAEANLGIRGIVFIGVGMLMLGMNAIYNRFRARFES